MYNTKHSDASPASLFKGAITMHLLYQEFITLAADRKRNLVINIMMNQLVSVPGEVSCTRSSGHDTFTRGSYVTRPNAPSSERASGVTNSKEGAVSLLLPFVRFVRIDSICSGDVPEGCQ